MKIRREGAYEDGHEYDITEVVSDFDPNNPDHVFDEDPDNPDWALECYLSQWSGDGHGIDRPKLGHSCEITILEAADLALVGTKFEFD